VSNENSADGGPAVPDHTAVRVALWRALHVEADPAPHVLEDTVGLRLVDPGPDWRERGDMDPQGTRQFRAGIVARARYVEDLVLRELAEHGVDQYVLLGAGLDTFVQRHPELGDRLRVFEVEQPATQEWKRRRLEALGFGVPQQLRLVPVDFESGASWWDGLAAGGFDAGRPAVVSSTGVSMYLSKEANAETLRQLAALAPGSTVAMTFQLPGELLDPEVRAGRERAEAGARAAGTPFLSFYAPEEIVGLARECGFTEVGHISADDWNALYFAHRPDGMRTPQGEELLLARV